MSFLIYVENTSSVDIPATFMIAELYSIRLIEDLVLLLARILTRINSISPYNCNEETIPLPDLKMTFADEGRSVAPSADYRKLPSQPISPDTMHVTSAQVDATPVRSRLAMAHFANSTASKHDRMMSALCSAEHAHIWRGGLPSRVAHTRGTGAVPVSARSRHFYSPAVICVRNAWRTVAAAFRFRSRSIDFGLVSAGCHTTPLYVGRTDESNRARLRPIVNKRTH